MIPGLKEIDRADDGVFRLFDIFDTARPRSAHTAGTVDHIGDGQLGETLLVAHLRINGQNIFQRGFEVTAWAIRIWPTDDHQTTAQVTNESFEGFHPFQREARSRD